MDPGRQKQLMFMKGALAIKMERSTADVNMSNVNHTRETITAPEGSGTGGGEPGNVATVRFWRCRDSEFEIAAVCSRITVDDCSDCTIAVGRKVLSAVVEVNHCEGLRMRFDVPVGTLQVDNSPSVSLTFADASMFGNLVWANAANVVVTFEGSQPDRLQTGTNFVELEEGADMGVCQFSVKYVDGAFVTDELVRIPGGVRKNNLEMIDEKAGAHGVRRGDSDGDYGAVKRNHEGGAAVVVDAGGGDGGVSPSSGSRETDGGGATPKVGLVSSGPMVAVDVDAPIPAKLPVACNNRVVRFLRAWIAKPGRRPEVALHLCSFAFFLVFTAESVVLGFSSSIIGGLLGYWNVAILYMVFSITSLFLALPVITWLGPIKGMMIASITYVLYCVANAFPQWATLLPAGILIGAGASVLWGSQGIYLTAAATAYCKERNMPSTDAVLGRYFGVFFGYTLLSWVPGNIMASLIMMSGKDSDVSVSSQSSSDTSSNNAQYTLTVLLLAGVCAVGTIALLFLPRFDYGTLGKTMKQQLVGAIMMMKNRTFCILIPYFLSLGCHTAFVLGEFTNCFLSPSLGADMIGFAMAVFGMSCGISAIVSGMVMDHFGPLVAGTLIWFISCSGCCIYFLVGLMVPSIGIFTSLKWVMFACAAILGTSLSSRFVQRNILTSMLFRSCLDDCLVGQRSWEAFGYVVIFAIGPFVSPLLKTWMQLGITIVAATSVLCVRWIPFFGGVIRTPSEMRQPSAVKLLPLS
ncbi:UNC93-like protein A [Pelomyxa schiedti]|nr:UNC93-like protein A [Pelomyxa schiedti]